MSGGAVNFKLNAPNVPGAVYSWTTTATIGQVAGGKDGNGTLINQTLLNPGEIAGQLTYTVIASNKKCVSQPLNILVNVIGMFKIPDIFSPNGDGKNDFFAFIGTNSYDMAIYNRWGNMMYEGNEASSFWDGRSTMNELCSEGVYFYILKAKDLNNKVFQGTVSLVR